MPPMYSMLSCFLGDKRRPDKPQYDEEGIPLLPVL